MSQIIVPFLHIIVATCIAIVALISSQPTRLVLCVVIAYFALQALDGLPTITSNPHYGSVLGLYILLWLTHLFNILLIERIVISGHTRLERCHIAYKWLTNGRQLNPSTTLAVKSSRSQNPTKSRDELERKSFLFHQAALCTSLFILNYIYEQHVILTSRPALYNPLSINDFSPAQATYLRRLLFPAIYPPSVTTRETTIRVFFVVHFIWTSYATFTFLHSACSILFVNVLRWDEPHEWPPLYGSLSRTYTIRGFWGGFWHRLVQRTYTSYGRALARSVGIAMRSSPERLFVAAFVFIMSGVMHVLVEWKIGMCGYMDSLTWFILNFIALAVEGCVLTMARSVLGPKITQWSGWRVIGYLWVWGFMFWSLPKGQYNKVFCAAATK